MYGTTDYDYNIMSTVNTGAGMMFLTTDASWISSDDFGYYLSKPKTQPTQRVVPGALKCRYCGTIYIIPGQGAVRCPGCGAPPADKEVL